MRSTSISLVSIFLHLQKIMPTCDRAINLPRLDEHRRAQNILQIGNFLKSCGKISHAQWLPKYYAPTKFCPLGHDRYYSNITGTNYFAYKHKLDSMLCNAII